MDPLEQERRDREFMAHALELAATTTALASPNPQVGCFIVRDDTILGEGAHLYDNYDHAEIVALKQAASRGLSVKGATAYVTLEPCSHHGRTGPCADALVAAGMKRVVVATLDPNPLVSGRGVEKLRAAGIDVVIGFGEQQAREINEAFAHFIRTRTPFVTLKAALSADGKLAPEDSLRTAKEPYWLTGAEAREDVQRLRHASDAALTGIGTVLADDPQLTDRSGISRRRPLLRVVLDSYLRTPLSSKLVRSAANDLLIFAGSSAPENRIRDLRSAGVEVEIVAEEDGRLSLPFILSRLGERQILSLLLEGGSELNGAFLRQRLVERVIFFHSQVRLGDQAIPFAEGIASPAEVEQALRRVTRITIGEDLRVSGYLRDPWLSQSPSES
ncbi:bifunctional diaminohydroxyphosphoribosylaminopyrimidine deaminase/5-amino-6-(5-phosphoribosylamino)uracil reductase RibD [Edaphobacter sp. 12200R-103]|uniref:bifunctional diaminohydroxyphosphoribosylaminopyrimidine deaminase/5-amino-6-(5-phosphoribosylamino)uracil reductase RibD n=1 Tax=Edaphobacter sp. 12200R-103 TaxID=2703788 RepID=UPI00138CFD0E|nr:bifunctional diaminohydroxyphosphoribosylaminopyrimidine deaminase/5-amino-6-(5-phosphoribosylamino)uracil reductase RibD [Edaphobacter sp. 12200R-103]QHS51885.1 bifunctional diaminohydroxyphosphoribosylaminopyrimidine deaminase/5-amino-6-(5-phosphoribosylamino)uracil reductase RibD [Edaphobacter sp. 12200R-103]